MLLSIDQLHRKDWTRWDPGPAETVLSHFGHPENRADLEADINRVCSKIATERNNIVSMTETHNALMHIDTMLYSIQSALDLHTLCGSNTSKHADLLAWLRGLSLTVSQLVKRHARVIKPRSDCLPAPLGHWLRSLTTAELSCELQTQYTAIASHYETDTRTAYDLLLQRSVIDPQLEALKQRLLDNRLSAKQCLFTTSHQQQSQAYFERLCRTSGVPHPLLSGIRDFELSRFASPSFSFAEALKLISNAFSQCHPECEVEINRLVTRGRLRLLPTSAQPDMCLDTPFGSYVQVHFDGTLSSVVRLAHEIGHAIHQHLHRESKWASVVLNAVDSETWALDFETVLLDYLVTEQPDHTPAILAFKQSRHLEMNHRHRMLHLFERGLHSTDIRSVDDIDALWLTTNRQFYGERLAFDAGFERSWTQVHHLYTAPFYLMVYGIARERADAHRPTHCIHQHYPQRTEYHHATKEVSDTNPIDDLVDPRRMHELQHHPAAE